MLTWSIRKQSLLRASVKRNARVSVRSLNLKGSASSVQRVVSDTDQAIQTLLPSGCVDNEIKACNLIRKGPAK